MKKKVKYLLKKFSGIENEEDNEIDDILDDTSGAGGTKQLNETELNEK